MSDSDKASASAAPSGSAAFTERELQMLGWAMQSLKTGPPDVCFVHPPSCSLTHK
jgi:hypothetical protein